MEKKSVFFLFSSPRHFFSQILTGNVLLEIYMYLKYIAIMMKQLAVSLTGKDTLINYSLLIQIVIKVSNTRYGSCWMKLR